MGDRQDHRDLHLERVHKDQLLLCTVPDWVNADWVHTVWICSHSCLRVIAGLEQVEWKRHEVVVHQATEDREEGHQEKHVPHFVQFFEPFVPVGKALAAR